MTTHAVLLRTILHTVRTAPHHPTFPEIVGYLAPHKLDVTGADILDAVTQLADIHMITQIRDGDEETRYAAR